MKKVLYSLGFVFLLSACSQNSHNSHQMETTDSEQGNVLSEKDAEPSLKTVLDERKAMSSKKASEEKKKIYAKGIADVERSEVTRLAKQLGDKAPDFSLTDAFGNTIRLSDRLKNGPVVLTWYRGGCCHYCNITLSRLQDELPTFKAEGAELIALTPELPDKSMNTAEKNALDFQVLSDVGSKVAEDFGVLYTLNDEVAAIYNAGFDLDSYNGDDKHELPLAATYVIDREGVIRFAFLDADYRNRAEPSDILAVLRALK